MFATDEAMCFKFFLYIKLLYIMSLTGNYKKLTWCWQTCAMCLEVSRGHQTQYHSIC